MHIPEVFDIGVDPILNRQTIGFIHHIPLLLQISQFISIKRALVFLIPFVILITLCIPWPLGKRDIVLIS